MAALLVGGIQRRHVTQVAASGQGGRDAAKQTEEAAESEQLIAQSGRF
jgi:hypothetical protein